MSDCLEERIEDLCKLSFFLHPIQKITTRIWFPWLLAPKRFVSLAAVSKNNHNIYYLFLATERPELDNYYYSLWSLFFSFLGFFDILPYFLVFSSISLNSQSIELYGFQKKKIFATQFTEFYSVLLPPSSSSKVILLISPTIQFFFWWSLKIDRCVIAAKYCLNFWALSSV